MDFKKIPGLIMIEQTLFALPFAYIGMLFAGGGIVEQWAWVTLALFGARTAGMSFNRVLDADIDKKNPRTAKRHLPSGELSRMSVWALAVVSSLLLVFSSYMLNILVFYLSFVAVAMLFTYSFFKRFSSSSHFYLGLVEAAAPVGGYLAVTGRFEAAAFLPGAAILFWIAALDMLYAIQDMEFDRAEGLHSVPSKYGKKAAYAMSAVSYFLSVASLAGAGILSGLGLSYYIFVAIVAVMFFFQLYLAIRQRGGIEASMLKVFFINRFISPAILAGVAVDFFIKNIK